MAAKADLLNPSWNLTLSPFAPVIRTNYAPSIEDIGRIKILLIEPLLELAQLESEVARIQSLLNALLLRRDHAKTFVEAHRALMSPIRRLPQETLSEIFIRCLPEGRHAIRSVAEAPLLLTAVSREWRRAAINTPALWNILHVFTPVGMNLPALSLRVIGFKLWLSRAGSLPLSISLSIGSDAWIHPGSSQRFSDGQTMFLEALTEFNTRLQELTLTGSNVDDIIDQMDILSSYSFPILDVLRIRSIRSFARGRSTSDSGLSLSSLVRQMPALNKLWIDGFTHHIKHCNQLPLRWDRLTELIVQPVFSGHIIFDFSPIDFPARDVLDMLRRIPHLQSLTFGVSIADWEPYGNVTLPDLRDMRLVFLKGAGEVDLKSFFHNFFCSIICPSLKAFTATQSGGRTHMYMPFSSFESLQRVEKLSLDMKMTPTSLLECLSAAPGTRSLEIGSMILGSVGLELPQDILPSTSCTMDDSVLSCLSNADLSLLPHLQHIRIIFRQSEFHERGAGRSSPPNPNTTITDNILLTFLESRVWLQEIKTLQSCDVFFSDPRIEFTEENLRRARVLIDSGLKLRIRYAKPQQVKDLSTQGLWMPRSSLPPGLQIIQSATDHIFADMEGMYGTGIIV